MAKTEAISAKSTFQNIKNLSPYDVKQLKTAFDLAKTGHRDAAQEKIDEFIQDKKGDRIRGLLISGATLVAAICYGRNTKAVQTVVKGISSLGDKIVKMIPSKGESVVSEIMNKGILSQGSKSRKAVSGLMHKIFKNEKIYSAISTPVKGAAKWLSNAVNVKTYNDVASVGIAAVVGTKLDDIFNALFDRADESIDENRRIIREGILND